jgi:hypothetical protein
LRPRADGGGENMTVVGVWQFELIDQVLVAGYEAIGYRPVDELDGPAKPSWVETGLFPEQ